MAYNTCLPHALLLKPSFSSTFSTGINTRDRSLARCTTSTAKRKQYTSVLNNSSMNFSQRHYTSVMEDATYTPGD